MENQLKILTGSSSDARSRDFAKDEDAERVASQQADRLERVMNSLQETLTVSGAAPWDYKNQLQFYTFSPMIESNLRVDYIGGGESNLNITLI